MPKIEQGPAHIPNEDSIISAVLTLEALQKAPDLEPWPQVFSADQAPQPTHHPDEYFVSHMMLALPLQEVEDDESSRSSYGTGGMELL